jgi:hypothetical protein
VPLRAKAARPLFAPYRVEGASSRHGSDRHDLGAGLRTPLGRSTQPVPVPTLDAYAKHIIGSV